MQTREALSSSTVPKQVPQCRPKADGQYRADQTGAES